MKSKTTVSQFYHCFKFSTDYASFIAWTLGGLFLPSPVPTLAHHLFFLCSCLSTFIEKAGVLEITLESQLHDSIDVLTNTHISEHGKN